MIFVSESGGFLMSAIHLLSRGADWSFLVDLSNSEGATQRAGRLFNQVDSRKLVVSPIADA